MGTASPTLTVEMVDIASTDEPTYTDVLQEIRQPRFESRSCPFEVPAGATIECGFVFVPEDHWNPEGSELRIFVVVIKDQGSGHLPDPVMLLSGGPGEKTVENTIVLAQILAPLRANRDLILFDQRGVGYSEPALECPEWEDAQLDLLDEADPEIAVKTVYEAWMICRDRLISEGHNLALYNTQQNAADVDTIRRALGYEEVNLFGGSYGSLLAQAVVRDYPEGIRSVVIDSVLPLEKSIFVEGSVTTSNAVLHLLDACAADEACSEAYPNLQQALFEVIDRLNVEPVPISITSPVDGTSYEALLTGRTVLSNLIIFLYSAQIIPVLPQAIYDVYQGDYELMTELSRQSLAYYGALSRGMMLSVVCTDDLIGRTPKDLLDIQAELPSQLVGDLEDDLIKEYGIFGLCSEWPVEESDPSVKEPLVSDLPILILAGEFDPVTPPEYGQLVAEHLENAYFFEFPGIGHSVAVSDECARQITSDFLDDPMVAPGALCITEMMGVVFDLPREATNIVLEPFSDPGRGFSGVVPAGWTEGPPLNYTRGLTALDPTTFVQDAAPMSQEALFAILAQQLGFDPDLESTTVIELGSFEWDFYEFVIQGYQVDLAMTWNGEKTFFVLLISEMDEGEILREQLLMPAVEALKSID